MRLPSPIRRRRAEQGMALVLALLILLALTALGTALMITVRTEGQIAGHQMRDTQALAIAEAGVQEAMLRLRTGDVPDNLNKRMVTLIYEAPAGSLPVSGADTTSLPTLQPAGSYLGYSSATKKTLQGTNPSGVLTPNGLLKDVQVLSIQYKTKITAGSPPDTQIVRYDDSANPKFNTATGTPVFSVIATGSRGTASRSVVAEVTRARFNILTKAALAADVTISFHGNIVVCGHDHRADTPVWAQPAPSGGNPVCDGIYTGAPGTGWWAATAHGSCMPGAWSGSTISPGGSSKVIGEPTATLESQTGFYSGPWDAMGMSQLDFWGWIGAPQAVVMGGVPSGIYYLDNDGIKQNRTGDWAFNGGNGDGMLYCDGNLSLNGNFTYRGLIYVEGNLEINGNCWILGGIVVRGDTKMKIASGSAVVLYSAESIQQNISKYGGNIRMLSWREF